MKRVLQITPYYPPSVGGVEQVVRDIVESLHGQYEQTILCFNHEKGYKEEYIDGVKIYRAKVWKKIASQSISFQFKKLLKKVLKEFKPDVIHFHFPNPFMSHYLLKQKFDAKLVVHWHGDIVNQKFLKKFFVFQTRKLLKRADKTIATSPIYAEHSEFLPLYKEKNIVIPCCVQDSNFNFDEIDYDFVNELRAKYKDKTICFHVGRHVQYKGIGCLTEAIPYFNENTQVLIGGYGPLTDKCKEKLHDNEQVVFLGVISRNQLKNYFAAADIFLFPSLRKNESFGIVLAEAMYFGVPIVNFHIEGSGTNYVSLNDITGIECENGNPKAFADAVNKLAADADLRKKLGDNAKQRAIENFLFATFKSNILDLYKNI